MDLEDLIIEGEAVKISCFKNTSSGGYLHGEDYEKWIAKATLYMERNYKDSSLFSRFISASEQAIGNGLKYYDTMIGILKAIAEYDK